MAESAYVALNAVLCGEVHVGDGAPILFSAVLTAEGGPVEIGTRCVVMEKAVLRGRESHPLRLGHNVLVGPHAHLNESVTEPSSSLPSATTSFWPLQERMDFPGTVFGLTREEATMDEIARRYSERFGRHCADRLIEG